MKIHVQQRGGFAGITHTLVDVDSANAGPGQASEIEQLARKLESVAAARAASSGAGGADFLTYDITVQDGPSRRTLKLMDDDSAGMEQVRTLLKQLSVFSQGTH